MQFEEHWNFILNPCVKPLDNGNWSWSDTKIAPMNESNTVAGTVANLPKYSRSNSQSRASNDRHIFIQPKIKKWNEVNTNNRLAHHREKEVERWMERVIRLWLLCSGLIWSTCGSAAHTNHHDDDGWWFTMMMMMMIIMQCDELYFIFHLPFRQTNHNYQFLDDFFWSSSLDVVLLHRLGITELFDS